MNRDVRLCVPAVFDLEYANALIRLNESACEGRRIAEVYGALPSGIVGSLRARLSRTASLSHIRDVINVTRNAGIPFNYALNASLLDGREHTREGRREIGTFIQDLIECGVERFTVAVPFLVQYINRHFPEVQITASVVAGVQSVLLAERYMDLGATRIVAVQDVNRRLDVLEALISSGADIELLVNSPCIQACPNRDYHANLTSIETSSALARAYLKPSGELASCLIHCRLTRLSSPSEYLRTPWIRPEDMRLYSNLGISHFKLDGRSAPAEYNLERVNAYLQGRFEGNLVYLLLQYVPRSLDDFRSGATEDLDSIYIDNAALDGLVEGMPCLRKEMSCKKCNYCDRAAARVAMVDERWLQARRTHLARELDERLSGRDSDAPVMRWHCEDR